jgi:8-amino-7-oxononanoate synthase
MLDFASSLYLGLGHPKGTLRSWARLTTGVPAALAEPPGAVSLSRRLAALTGCESAVIAPSTLHLFFDVIEILRPLHGSILVEAGTYPVAVWGVERAASRGMTVRLVGHHDPDHLLALVRRSRRTKPPLVVADGVCVDCGKPAPIDAYAAIVARRGGLLVVDDTQGLGLFGRQPAIGQPWGVGGGGTAVWHGLAREPTLVLASSLAKGFGAPLAVLAGSSALVRRFASSADTRVHASPPSAAAIAGATAALDVNARDGDARRRRLLENIAAFRNGAAELGLEVQGGMFPVQSLPAIGAADPATAHRMLAELGIRAVLRKTSAAEIVLTVVIRANHRRPQIVRLLEALELCSARRSSRVAVG